MPKLETTPASVRLYDKVFPFPGTFEAVSNAYLAAASMTGATSSGETGPLAPRCQILDQCGKTLAIASYNGRVWLGDKLHLGAVLLFDPYQGKE